MQNNIIPIVMICDKNFIMQTEVALMSLKINKRKDSFYNIFVVMVDADFDLTTFMQKMCNEYFRIQILHVTVEKYKIIRQLAHVPLASLLKFDICDLIPYYNKLLYLDGDIIVRDDLSDLYHIELADNYVAGVPHSLGIVTKEKKLNGGVLLFNAEKIRNEKLRDVFLSTRQSLGERKSMDQETFHVVFGEKKIYIHPKYNVMVDKIDYEKKYYSLRDYNTFFNTSYKSRKEIFDRAVILHFTGNVKPWKYKFGKCTKEWYKYYLKTFGDFGRDQRKGRMFYCRELIKDNGIRGLYWKVKDVVLSFLGEHMGIFVDKKYGEWK